MSQNPDENPTTLEEVLKALDALPTSFWERLEKKITINKKEEEAKTE